MEPIKDEEQKSDEDVLDQTEPSISGYQSSLNNPFEALMRSSSDEEVKQELASILRLVGRDEQKRLFNIGLPDAEPKSLFGTGSLLREWHDSLQSLEHNMWNVSVTVGPFVNTYTNSSELKELESRNKLGPSSFLSHRLYHSHVWMMRYESNREDENNSTEIHLKVMSPVMFAALTSKPNIVHFLMKYGTRFLDETRVQSTDDDSVSMRMACMRALLSDIITELFGNPEVWDSDSLELKTDLSSLPEGLRSKCLNFRLLLRCDPNPYVTTVKLATLIGPQLPPLPGMIVLRHIYDSLFPDLGLGLFNPPQLQHVCRCVIRRRLHENWQLPDGISQLELSKILCDYINLLDD